MQPVSIDLILHRHELKLLKNQFHFHKYWPLKIIVNNTYQN